MSVAGARDVIGRSRGGYPNPAPAPAARLSPAGAPPPVPAGANGSRPSA